jgi:hypothetical protein
MEGKMEPGTLAATAIGAALPYLLAFGKEAAKGAAGGVGKTVWDWVKGKLTSSVGQEVIADFEKNPKDDDNRKAAEAALSKFLKSDTSAINDLAKLLEKAGVTATTQTATTIGDDNITAQAAGTGNTLTIGRPDREKDQK